MKFAARSRILLRGLGADLPRAVHFQQMNQTKRFRIRLLLLIVGGLVFALFAAIDSSKLRPVAGIFAGELHHALAILSPKRSNQPIPSNETDSSMCGPPNYACSYSGTDPKPLCTNCNRPPVPDMSAEPNAVWYDKVFGMAGNGNQIVRCTYPNMAENGNRVYSVGFGGSGDENAIGKGGGSPLSYRLIIDDSEGLGYPFTYTPDPVHPTCVPTYPIGSVTVADGSFSWLIPHLYYGFGGYHFKIFAIHLDSIDPPDRQPIADFQQILPRDGPDWPGAKRAVPLGAIIRPLDNNAGGYLYQATCSPRQTGCPAGLSGRSVPNFGQTFMADTTDGSIVWRNIGPGFNGPASWYAVGGLSTDDDVFAKSFSDEGGRGALFVAAYQRSANVYYLYNVGTGIISYANCAGGIGYLCAGGSWVQTTVGMTDLPDRYFLHNLKISKNGKWLLLSQDSCAFQTCSTAPGSFQYLWQISKTSVAVHKIAAHPGGHWTTGFGLLVNLDGDPLVNLNGRPFADPEKQFPLNYYLKVLPHSLGTKTHPSWNYNDGSDITPVCSATSSFDWPYVVPWENEVICYGTNPNPDCSTPGHGACRNTVRRFFHTYNPGTCDMVNDFSGCYGIGALSQDGKYYAFTSNWGNTLGSTSTGGSGPDGCKGGFNFQKNYAYHVGDVFEPGDEAENGHRNSRFSVYQVTVAGSSSSYPPGAWPTGWVAKQDAGQGFYMMGDAILPPTSPDNPCNHYFQVTAGGGKATGSHPPAWKDVYGYSGSCSAVAGGASVKDGAVTWTDMGEYVLGTMHLANIGQDDCRSDVFIGTLN